jgi:hypothetical protein
LKIHFNLAGYDNFGQMGWNTLLWCSRLLNDAAKPFAASIIAQIYYMQTTAADKIFNRLKWMDM